MSASSCYLSSLPFKFSSTLLSLALSWGPPAFLIAHPCGFLSLYMIFRLMTGLQLLWLPHNFSTSFLDQEHSNPCIQIGNQNEHPPCPDPLETNRSDFVQVGAGMRWLHRFPQGTLILTGFIFAIFTSSFCNGYFISNLAFLFFLTLT